jgi:hypothetical protein
LRRPACGRDGAIGQRAIRGSRVDADAGWRALRWSGCNADGRPILGHVQRTIDRASRVAEIVPCPGELRTRFLEGIVIADDPPLDPSDAGHLEPIDPRREVVAGLPADRWIARADGDEIAAQDAVDDRPEARSVVTYR